MEVMEHIPSYTTIQGNHALVSYDGQPSTHYTDTTRHRHGEELNECADSSMTCAVMEQVRSKRLKRRRDALDLRSLGILLSF